MADPAQVLENSNDVLLGFLLETSGVRGVLVRLTDTWLEVGHRADYPPAVAACLGETLAATALMTGHVKVDGRLSVQLRGTGALRSIFAECTREGTLRGLAHYSEPLPDPLTPRAFGEGSVLAITIETGPFGGHDGMRYQGMVGLDADSLAEAFEGYFSQSEQLPTRMLLATDDQVASGLMLQKLPGKSNEGDGWQRAIAIFETLGRDELLATEPADLLYRLFHEDNVHVMSAKPLRFGCSCSRERVAAMFEGLGRDEAMAALQSVPAATDQTTIAGNSPAPREERTSAYPERAEVNCQFCGRSYQWTREDLSELFEQPPMPPAPDTLQ